jgi:hypothetical protein
VSRTRRYRRRHSARRRRFSTLRHIEARGNGPRISDHPAYR